MRIHYFSFATHLRTLGLIYAAMIFEAGFAAHAADDPVKIDNDRARVLLVNSAPGAKSELHEHAMNRVMIYLDAGKMTLTDTAGKVETLNFKAGEVLWSPATTRPHVSLNVTDHPVRIVEVELKSKPGAVAAAKPSDLDWVKMDPKHCRVEIENDQVRVVRARYGPREKGVMHEHVWSYVVSFLTDCQLKVTTLEGQSGTAINSPGEMSAGRPSKHIEENLSDKPIEVVVVEFKK
jgi:quercetin dioxygenase-like cupin family protein